MEGEKSNMVPQPRTAEGGKLTGRTLRELTDDFKLRCQRAAENILMIGYDLTEIKSLCDHGKWLDWLRSVGWKERTAENYIRVANTWNESPTLQALGYSRTVALLEAPTALQEEIATTAQKDDLSVRQIKELTKQLKAAEIAKNDAEHLAESRLHEAKASEARLRQAQDELDRLKRHPATVEVEPEDYADLKDAVEALKQERDDLEQAVQDAEERAEQAVAQAQAAMTEEGGQTDWVSAQSFVRAVNTFLSQVQHLPFAGEAISRMSPEDKNAMNLFTDSVTSWARQMGETLRGARRVTVFPAEGAVGDE